MCKEPHVPTRGEYKVVGEYAKMATGLATPEYAKMATGLATL